MRSANFANSTAQQSCKWGPNEKTSFSDTNFVSLLEIDTHLERADPAYQRMCADREDAGASSVRTVQDHGGRKCWWSDCLDHQYRRISDSSLRVRASFAGEGWPETQPRSASPGQLGRERLCGAGGKRIRFHFRFQSGEGDRVHREARPGQTRGNSCATPRPFGHKSWADITGRSLR